MYILAQTGSAYYYSSNGVDKEHKIATKWIDTVTGPPTPRQRCSCFVA